MATVTRENIGNLHDKITIKLAKEDYWPSFEKSLKQYAKNVNIPGFRKGMVPSGMVRKMYGQSIYGDEVVRTASRQLEDYMNGEKLQIFAQPMILPNAENVRLDMNNPAEVDFSFEVGLKPDFEITPLKNKTHLTRYKVTVADKMIDDEVDRIRRRYGKVEDQETVSTKDDILYLTYEATDAEGNVSEESQKVDDTAALEKMPAKLQEMVMGKKADDTVIFRPADVSDGEELEKFLKDPLKQGAEAAEQYYKLTITKIGLLIPRELGTDLYAQVFPNGDVPDEATFKTKIREELTREFERIANDRLQSEIYEVLVHNTNMTLPTQFLKRWLKEGGEKPKSEREVENEFSTFEHQLRWTLISDKLIIENGIQVTRDEVVRDVKTRVLAYFGMGADDEEDATWLDSYMAKVVKEEKTMDETYRRLLFGKLFSYLETQFDIEDKEIDEEAFFKLSSAHEEQHQH